MKALTDLWMFATAWYNIPFTLSLLAFLALSALQFVGLDHGHDADADVHVDLDHDLAMDHDASLDHDLDVDHDVSLDHAADVDHDLDHDVSHDFSHAGNGAPAWLGVLEFLGAGQTPVTMILLVLLGGFGMLGWLMNGVLLGLTSRYPAGWGGGLAFLVILGINMFIGAVFTGRVARFLGRAVPAFASTATPLKRLVSRRGRVASPQVDEKYGQVKVRDTGGTLITVFAVVDPGQPPIPRDTEVILVEFDAARKVFVVVPSDMDA